MEEMDAHDKIDAIAKNLYYCDVNYTYQIKTVSDMEKLFDYCTASDEYEFIDQIPYDKRKELIGY